MTQKKFLKLLSEFGEIAYDLGYSHAIDANIKPTKRLSTIKDELLAEHYRLIFDRIGKSCLDIDEVNATDIKLPTNIRKL